MKNKKTYYGSQKKLWQRILFGFLAVVLSAGLVLSSMVWILDRDSVPENLPRQELAGVTAADLEEKAKASPNDINVLLELAAAYQNEGNIQRAVETYEKAVSLAPGRDDLKSRLAGGYIALGQHDRAIIMLEEVTGRHPNDKEARYYYGHALAGKREYKRAVEEFEMYIKLAGEGGPEVEGVRKLIDTLRPLAEKQQ